MYKLQKINFLQNILNRKELFSNLEWCLNNYNNICISNEKERLKYQQVIKYLLNTKKKDTVLTEEEAKMMMVFFSKDFAFKLNIAEKIKIQFKEDDPNLKDVWGSFEPAKDGSYKITYYNKSINSLIKKRKFPVKALRIIFHEVIHAAQHEMVEIRPQKEDKKHYNVETYMITVENMLRDLDENFYDKNYAKLYKENNANKIGLQCALVYLKEYVPKAYKKRNKQKIYEKINSYDIDYYNEYIEYFDSTENYLELMDIVTILSIQQNKKILEKYPILKLAYNEDGSRKNIIELLEERNALLENHTKKEVDELFKVFIYRNKFDEDIELMAKKESVLLMDYIRQTNTQDSFVYDVLKHRLEQLEPTKNFNDLTDNENNKKK